MEDEGEKSSLRHRRKKSAISISCCFHGSGGHGNSLSSCPLSSASPTTNFKPSPSSWFRSISRAPVQESPETRVYGTKCRNLLSRVGRQRRHSSADFSYDPLSYALNFENEEEAEFVPIRNFAARLPASPPPSGRRGAEGLPEKMEALELKSKGSGTSTLNGWATPARGKSGQGSTKRREADLPELAAREILVEAL